MPDAYQMDGIYRDDPRDLRDDQVRIGETVYTVKELPAGNGYFCEADGCGDEEDRSTWVEAAYELSSGMCSNWHCTACFERLTAQEGRAS